MPRVLEAHAAMNLAGGYEFGHDFYPVWLTSRKCIQRSCDPYGPEITHEIQQGIFGRPLDPNISSDPPVDYRTFAYPAFTILLFWPAGKLPFSTVRVIVFFLLAGLTLASVIMWMEAVSWHLRPSLLVAIALLVLCSYPVLEGLYAGQLGLLVGFLFAASLLALRRGRLFFAGAILAFTTIKPQMTILAGCYLLLWSSHNWRQRGRFCIGFFSAMFILGGAAILVWPHWIQSWTSVLLGYRHYSNPPLVSEVVAAPLGLKLGRIASAAMIGALVLLSVVVSWKERATGSSTIQFWLTSSLTLCITAVTLLPSQGFQDQVILLPAIFLLSCQWKELSRSRVSRALLAAGAGILLWQWVAAIGLIVARPLLSDQDFYSKAVFAMPVRTAAAFPFALLAAIALAYRQARADFHSKPQPS